MLHKLEFVCIEDDDNTTTMWLFDLKNHSLLVNGMMIKSHSLAHTSKPTLSPFWLKGPPVDWAERLKVLIRERERKEAWASRIFGDFWLFNEGWQSKLKDWQAQCGGPGAHTRSGPDQWFAPVNSHFYDTHRYWNTHLNPLTSREPNLWIPSIDGLLAEAKSRQGFTLSWVIYCICVCLWEANKDNGLCLWALSKSWSSRDLPHDKVTHSHLIPSHFLWMCVRRRLLKNS